MSVKQSWIGVGVLLFFGLVVLPSIIGIAVNDPEPTTIIPEIYANYPSESCIELINEQREIELNWREDVWFVTQWKANGCHHYFDDPQLALDKFEEKIPVELITRR